VWRGKNKVLVADPHRAIIDILDEPKFGGGIQHVADCLQHYFTREYRDDDQLLGIQPRAALNLRNQWVSDEFMVHHGTGNRNRRYELADTRAKLVE